MDERVEFVKLLETFNTADIAFIKSLLEAYEMTYYIEGENFTAIRPLVAPAIIWIDREILEDARELLKDYKSGKFGFQID